MNKLDRHKYIQILIKGLRNCLIDPSTLKICEQKVEFNFTSKSHEKFETFRNDLGLTADLLRLNLSDQYIIKESIYNKDRLIFFNSNFKLVIKTIKKNEKDFILSILPAYIDHVKNHKDTLLSKILICVKVSFGTTVSYVIIMNNALPCKHNLYEIYDLKGSSYKRLADSSTSTLKDLDWKSKHRKLYLRGKKGLLINQIINDCEFLESLNILDYSIIIGIQNGTQMKKNMFRKYQNGEIIGDELREGVNFNNSILFKDSNGYLSENDGYQEVYYIGIIDFLTLWTWKKKAEKLLGDCCCKENISCLHPKEYKDRFIEMIKNDLFFD